MRVVVSAPARFHLFDLARQLQERGMLARLFTGYPLGRVDSPLQESTTALPVYGVAVYVLGRMRDGWVRREIEWQFIERYDCGVARRLREADVVVGLSGRFLHTLRRARQLGARVVCDRGSCHIVHQDEVLAEEHARWRAPYRPVDPRGLAKELAEYDEADLITVPSRFARATFEAHGVLPAKLAVVPYGVDLRMFRPGQQPNRHFRVLFAGQVSLRKGVPYLLEAVEPLRSRPGVAVWVAGRTLPDARQWLRRFEGHFRLLGHLSPRDLARVFARSSVFVLPSIEEGLAVVIPQAMASGLPVIATAESGAEELITDGVEGFIVPSRSSNAIKERLMRLYKDADLRIRMGRAAMERVRQLGGWQDYGQRVLNAYSALC